MLDRIKECLAENYDLEVDNVTEKTELVNDLGLSSFQLVEMCSDLEEEFSVEFSEDDMAKIVTVGDLIALIEK